VKRLGIFILVGILCLVVSEAVALKQIRNDFTGTRQYIANKYSELRMDSSTKTGDYTVLVTDTLLLGDASSGGITFTLPAVSGNSGLVFFIKKKDVTGNTVTVDANGSETIDDGLTAVLTMQYEAIMIANDGSVWHIL